MSKLRSRHFGANFAHTLGPTMLAGPGSPRHAKHPATAALGAKLDSFRQLMVDAKDLSEIHDYFHDALVADPSFMPASSPASNERLVEIMAELGRRCGGDKTLQGPFLYRIPEHGFWHGCAVLAAGQMLITYFESIDVGLCCYSRSLADPRSDFFRFSIVEVPDDTLPGPVTRGQA